MEVAVNHGGYWWISITFTDTEVNTCFCAGYTTQIQKNIFISSRQYTEEWPEIKSWCVILSHKLLRSAWYLLFTNESAHLRAVMFTCEVYANNYYDC